MPLDVIVLAAGQGKRMRSDLPKVLHPLAGRALLAHVLDTARALSPRKTIVVHGHGAERVRAAFPQADLEWVLQAEQLGTGHAVLQAIPEIPKDRMVLVPNGIDVDRFAAATENQRMSLRRSLGLRVDRPVVVFVGFFSADKQPRVLFDAWLQLQRRGVDATLVFVGATESKYFEVDSTIAPAMRAEATAAGVADRVTFAGVTRDVPSYLRSADIFVLSSRREGLPVALLEAMACALPCVASRLPGSTDAVVEHGVNGLLTTPGDVGELADAMQSLIDDPGERARLGSAARATIVDRYSSDTIADRWLEAYASVLNR